VGLTTITLGPDGEPVEETVLCPDSNSIFAADFTLPVLERPGWRLVAVVAPFSGAPVAAQPERAASARGPPALI
jgi:hypothetical protein